jgi:hypothetical protein
MLIGSGKIMNRRNTNRSNISSNEDFDHICWEFASGIICDLYVMMLSEWLFDLINCTIGSDNLLMYKQHYYNNNNNNNNNKIKDVY